MKEKFSKNLVNEFPRFFTRETSFRYDAQKEELKCLYCFGRCNFSIWRGAVSVEFCCDKDGYEFLDHFCSKDIKELSDWISENWSKYDDRDIIPIGSSDWYVRSITDDEDDLPF